MSFVILGIDPGTRITGYGLIRKESRLSLIDYGSIKPPPKMDLHKRYHLLYENIKQLIHLHKPDALVVESQFVQKNVQSAMKLGMAKGVVYILAAKYHIPLFEYAPKKAKQAVVGSGGASKHQVQKMIQLLFSLQKPPTPEDAADALSLAICHAHQPQWKR